MRGRKFFFFFLTTHQSYAAAAYCLAMTSHVIIKFLILFAFLYSCGRILITFLLILHFTGIWVFISFRDIVAINTVSCTSLKSPDPKKWKVHLFPFAISRTSKTTRVVSMSSALVVVLKVYLVNSLKISSDPYSFLNWALCGIEAFGS